MSMITRTSPGVEWKEIDKSTYTPTMNGTAVYVAGFSTKGEPYKPIEFTSRTAFESFYGTPDNEAERYFYSAVCEALNQGARLFTARLPYDNEAFEKMVGIKYSVATKKQLSAYPGVSVINEYDSEIKDVAVITGGKDPILYDLSSVDEFRTDEAKVPANTFLIVDTTGATYGRVTEDYRKGQKREVIGIVPVVTTAANALYAQSLIQLSSNRDVRYFETLSDKLLKTLKATDKDGNVLSIDGNEMTAGGLLSSDLVKLINTEDYFSFVSSETIWSTTIDMSKPTSSFMTYEEAQKCVEDNPGTSISSCVIPYMLSADKYTNDFPLSIAFYTETTAYAPSVDLLNERSAICGLYSCESDAINIGLNLANMFLNETESTIGPGKLSTVISCCISGGEEHYENVILTFVDETERNDISVDLVNKVYPRYTNVSGYDMLSAGHSGYVVGEASYTSSTVDIDESDPRYGWHGKNGDDSVPDTIALDAANFFSTIQPAVDGVGFDPEHLKDIGVVVYRTYLDPSEGNKVSIEPVEAYCGSLFKDDKDPNTGVTKFIDTIINSQSKYINFFSNCFSSKTEKDYYKKECDMIVAQPSTGAALGLYSPMTKEDISISKSILDGLNKAFDKNKDIHERDIDIVVDAGVSNIASYLKAIFGNKGPYDLAITDDLGNSLLGMWKCQKATDAPVKMWKSVVQKIDNYCKNMRKDCMFITECPRPLVLQGQKKIIRDSKPANNIDVNILPYLPSVCGLNTNFGAGYLDWFEQADDYTGDFFWCPPSIKAMGIYVNTDVNFNYWDAPAGLNRGMVACTDVAFSPDGKQAGSIYQKSWNYAINYPQDGVILEGQKTFQVKPSALDRVNVRRTMLRLERAVYKIARYYVYEPNTAYTRQRLVDALDPIFKACCQNGNGGIQRYKIICDESNNTANTIDNNELHVSIGVVPTKTIEFLGVDFILGSQGSTWEELF